MSEAEMITAFQGFIGLTNQLFFGYVSLLSGYLVMSYLVAEKISSLLASISVAMFSIVSLLLMFGMLLSQNNAEQIMAIMRAQAESGQIDLAWHAPNPTWAADVMSALYVVAALGGYLASVAYFFYKRTQGDHAHAMVNPAVLPIPDGAVSRVAARADDRSRTHRR